MTADELRNLLVTLLVGATGGTEAKWRKAVGEVEKLPLTLHPKSNWRISPKGRAADREVIARAVDIVRAEHPYVE